MHKTLGRSMPGYRIRGACNPGMAREAIGMEPRLGAMLPCNVVLREPPDGEEVGAIDPVASRTAIDNDGLKAVARQVRALLEGGIAAADLVSDPAAMIAVAVPRRAPAHLRPPHAARARPCV